MSLLYIDNNLYYNVFHSKNRIIYSPCSRLKVLQKEILQLIKLKYKIQLNIKKASIVHCNQKWLLKTDIENFYESFSSIQIKKALDDFYCNILFPQYITKNDLYKICTINDKLPTGAITSAHIANYAFSQTQIDDKLLDFCRKNQINYSRYMDDMFFSSDSKQKLILAEKLVIKLLSENGFFINKEKTKYISDNKKQEVLGLIVNNAHAPVISKNNKRKYRSLIFNYLKSVFLEEKLGIGTLFLKKTGYEEIIGYISYFKSSDYAFYLKMQKYILTKIISFRIILK